MLTSSIKKSRRPASHGNAPTVTPFAKLAEDRLWRARLLKHILSTVGHVNRNNISSVDSRKSSKPIFKLGGFRNKILKNRTKDENGLRKAIEDETPVLANLKVNTLVLRDKMPNKTSSAIKNENINSTTKAKAKSKHNHSADVTRNIKHKIAVQNITETVKAGPGQPTKNIIKIAKADPQVQNTKNIKEKDVISKMTNTNTAISNGNNKLSGFLNNSSSDNEKHILLNEAPVSHNGTMGKLDKPNLFSKDNIPKVYRNTVIPNDTIHFCMIAAGQEMVKQVKLLVKSIFIHARRSDVMFHFVTDNEPHEHIAKIFDDFDHPFVTIAYEVVKTDLRQYLRKQLGDKVEFTSHWSGIRGVGKVFMYDLLPDVEKCIVLDTDVVFATDPAFLWSDLQSKVQPPVAIGVMKMGDNDVDSGLMLQNLELLRNVSFGKLIPMEYCRQDVQNKSDISLKCLNDQILINSVVKSHPGWFDKTLSYSWNLGLCLNFRNFTFASFEDEAIDLFFGAVHFSCNSFNKHNDAVEGLKQVPKRDTLQKYIQYLKETDFKDEKWKEGQV